MCKTQKHFAVLLLFSMIMITESTTGQKRKSKKDPNYIGQDINNILTSRSTKKGNVYYNFPNVNKLYHYYNVSKKQNILNLISKGDNDKKLTSALESYIGNFGIRNFSEDTDYIWLLAQLYEKKEAFNKAKAMYRLALKHQKRNTIPEISKLMQAQQKFSNLTQLEKDLYVPLDYYYQLVEYRKHVDTLRPPKSVLTNMGDLVNHSGIADYAPSISVNDQIILFTKRTLDSNHLVNDRNQHVRYNENLYWSQGYEDGFWDKAEKFESPINTGCNEGSGVLSRDGKTLYFTRCMVEDNRLDCSDCLGECDVYVTKKEKNDKWSKPKNLGPQINTNAWESHPTLSRSEDTLYFASSRGDGFGLADIWFTYKIDKHGHWAKAQNMGPTINTCGNEYSPFFSRKTGVFYFSSNGQIMNFNDLENKSRNRTLDIYKAYKENGHWKEPKNVGPLVNGKGDEYYFSIDSKSEYLYYAKTEDGTVPGKSITDLYSFPVPMEAQPTATVNLHGTLIDKDTKETYKGIVSVIDLENGIEVAPKEVREDGSFDFDLIDHKKYLLVIQGDEFFRIEKLFELKGDTTIINEATSIKNKKLQFSSLVFQNGKWDILPEMDQDLWNIVDFLIDNPMFALHIGGHTDSDGDSKKNHQLSQKRADAIKTFIVKNGNIKPERIEAKGHGSEKPIKSPEVTEEDKQINRRVEFELISSKQDKIFTTEEE